jgi:hypothetical protein
MNGGNGATRVNSADVKPGAQTKRRRKAVAVGPTTAPPPRNLRVSLGPLPSRIGTGSVKTRHTFATDKSPATTRNRSKPTRQSLIHLISNKAYAKKLVAIVERHAQVCSLLRYEIDTL